jgi:hypothetical protein
MLNLMFNKPSEPTTDAGNYALLQMLGYNPAVPPFVIPDGAPRESSPCRNAPRPRYSA